MRGKSPWAFRPARKQNIESEPLGDFDWRELLPRKRLFASERHFSGHCSDAERKAGNSGFMGVGCFSSRFQPSAAAGSLVGSAGYL